MVYLHKTLIITDELTIRPGRLLASQYIVFPLSDFEALIFSDDIVLSKLSEDSLIDVDELVKSVDDMNHVMLAGGKQYDVVQVKVICCSADTLIGDGFTSTYVTGATIIQTKVFLCKAMTLNC